MCGKASGVYLMHIFVSIILVMKYVKITCSCRYLQNNKIEELPPGIFINLSELRYL